MSDLKSYIECRKDLILKTKLNIHFSESEKEERIAKFKIDIETATRLQSAILDRQKRREKRLSEEKLYGLEQRK